jgi:hypothetical protein
MGITEFIAQVRKIFEVQINWRGSGDRTSMSEYIPVEYLLNVLSVSGCI